MGLLRRKQKTPKAESSAESQARDVAAAQRAVMERELQRAAPRVARFEEAERQRLELEEVSRSENAVSRAVRAQEEILRGIAERRRREAEVVERARVGEAERRVLLKLGLGEEAIRQQEEILRDIAERRRLEELGRGGQAIRHQEAILREAAERRRLEGLGHGEMGAAMRQQEVILRDIAERRALERSVERASWEGEARPEDVALPLSYQGAPPTYEEVLREG